MKNIVYPDFCVAQAQVETDCCNDFFALLKCAASYAVNGEETAAAIPLGKAVKLAVFSSDYLDIAEFLCRFHRMKDFFSVKHCLQKAKKAAKIYCDFVEIENFEHKYNFC
ncbi:MAG: hypothetical protein IKB77_04475 [Lentisphaeria bacterium]|nr:hypothetical protein [Lentisphaeria bacterium]